MLAFPIAKCSGSIVSWGNDYHGLVSDTPAGSDFIDIAGEGAYSLALTPESATLLLLGLGAVMLRRKRS